MSQEDWSLQAFFFLSSLSFRYCLSWNQILCGNFNKSNIDSRFCETRSYLYGQDAGAGGRGHRKYYWFEWRWNVRKTGVAIYWNVQRMTTAMQKPWISSIITVTVQVRCNGSRKKKKTYTQNPIKYYKVKSPKTKNYSPLSSWEVGRCTRRLCQTNLISLHLLSTFSNRLYLSLLIRTLIIALASFKSTKQCQNLKRREL